ncbi:hypothetical protein EJ08DRAFT_653981 [Tothia fuscella]|uniref:Asl1-like glycosyl hydrolase catalytic domain-containing protein n=1 Tax=Tothia fuscella TaxID=1048955 RepID=A0A9P4NFX9_9PEZI|nr:hypothetical protein EJ08DRAFT_653981 [Tothia fuscella]
MSVDHAVEFWRQHVLPMKQSRPEVRIGSLSISNGSNGIPWLGDFFSRFGGIDASGIDYIIIHYYSDDAEHFKRYVKEVHDKFEGKIWVTEFSCTNWNVKNPPTEKQVLTFMEEALNFLDSTDFVERYAWYGAMSDVGVDVGRANGFQAEGRLTDAGKLYMTL